jgi:hypothetical protein
MTAHLNNLLEFIRRDFRSYPLRFLLELFAWSGTLVNTILITLWVPNVPWLICYPIWITGCCAAAWTSWTRGSSIGMWGCILFATLDTLGFIRYLLSLNIT